jgi:hypothetical protein
MVIGFTTTYRLIDWLGAKPGDILSVNVSTCRNIKLSTLLYMLYYKVYGKIHVFEQNKIEHIFKIKCFKNVTWFGSQPNLLNEHRTKQIVSI